MKVMMRGGKPLIKNGKVALTGDDDKCCGPCGGGCVPQASVSASFSGISLCSCVNISALGDVIKSWLWLTDPGVNGSFTAPFVTSGVDFAFYRGFTSLIGGGAGDPGDNFAAFSDTACTVEQGSGGQFLILDVTCSSSSPGAGWYFTLRSAPAGYGFIFDAFVPFGGIMTGIPNLVGSCGSYVDLFSTTWGAIGHGGIANLII